MNGIKYRYKLGDNLWYIDTVHHNIQKDIITHEGAFYKEYSSSRQLAIYILQESKEPTRQIIEKHIKDYIKHTTYMKNKPYESEAYCFKGGPTIPVEFISKDLDDLMRTRYNLFEIFYNIYLRLPGILTGPECEHANNNERNLRYFR